MYLYFQNSQGQFSLVSDKIKSMGSVHSVIRKDVFRRNKNFRIYYFREWMGEDGMWYDVGSHTEFYLLTDKCKDLEKESKS